MRGPVLRPPCMRQRSLPRIAGARQGQPARVRAPQRGASARLGLPRRFGEVLVGMADARMLDAQTLEQLAKRIEKAKGANKGGR